MFHSHLSSWEQWIWVGHAAASVKVWITCWEHLPGTCPWAGNQQSRGFFSFLTNLSYCKQKNIRPRRAWMCFPLEVHWARRWKSVLWQLLPIIFFLFPSLLPIYIVQLLGLSRKKSRKSETTETRSQDPPWYCPSWAALLAVKWSSFPICKDVSGKGQANLSCSHYVRRVKLTPWWLWGTLPWWS